MLTPVTAPCVDQCDNSDNALKDAAFLPLYPPKHGTLYLIHLSADQQRRRITPESETMKSGF